MKAISKIMRRGILCLSCSLALLLCACSASLSNDPIAKKINEAIDKTSKLDSFCVNVSGDGINDGRYVFTIDENTRYYSYLYEMPTDEPIKRITISGNVAPGADSGITTVLVNRNYVNVSNTAPNIYNSFTQQLFASNKAGSGIRIGNETFKESEESGLPVYSYFSEFAMGWGGETTRITNTYKVDDLGCLSEIIYHAAPEQGGELRIFDSTVVCELTDKNFTEEPFSQLEDAQ